MKNQIIKLTNDEYQRYEELLIKKDVLKKEAIQYRHNYIREFGDLLNKAFESKIHCIEKKKIIAYCQKIINKGGIIDPIALEDYISNIMKDYYEELREMLELSASAKNSLSISEHTLRKIKKIYYSIAKIIHPDMNPKLQKDKTINDLWNRIVIAYECNNLEELEELQVLVNNYLKSINYEYKEIVIPNIAEKIFKLNDEIKKIINTDPYQFKYLLADKEAIKEYKQDIENEIKDYENYAKELDEVISKFNIERKYS